MEKIIDVHSHLWLRQDTTWNGQVIRSTHNGRSMFLGEEVQMLPPFMTDGRNTAEVFLANMDYAQVLIDLVKDIQVLGHSQIVVLFPLCLYQQGADQSKQNDEMSLHNVGGIKRWLKALRSNHLNA